MSGNDKPDSGLFGLGATTAIGVVAISVGLAIWKNGGINSHGLADMLMLVAFIVFLGWLVLPRRPKDG
jgi:hypothetical protein